MPYRIVKQPRAWWPVVWNGVAEDGSIVENRIELRFRLLKVDEATAFVRDVVAAQRQEDNADTDLPALYADLVKRIADDWREVAGENGETLPWTTDNLCLLMNEGGMLTHIYEAFQDCLSARKDLRQGN